MTSGDSFGYKLCMSSFRLLPIRTGIGVCGALLVLSLTACHAGSSDRLAPPDQRALPQAAPVVEPSPSEAPSGQDALDRAEAMIRHALAEAARGATGAAEATCEQALQEATAMVRRLRSQNVVGDGVGEPNPEAFLAACRRLPEEMQRCTVPSYSMTNTAECAAARDRLDPEVRREVQGLVRQAL